jgi:alpha-tubulin suppressor-like RCC1 family protein
VPCALDEYGNCIPTPTPTHTPTATPIPAGYNGLLCVNNLQSINASYLSANGFFYFVGGTNFLQNQYINDFKYSIDFVFGTPWQWVIRDSSYVIKAYNDVYEDTRIPPFSGWKIVGTQNITNVTVVTGCTALYTDNSTITFAYAITRTPTTTPTPTPTQFITPFIYETNGMIPNANVMLGDECNSYKYLENVARPSGGNGPCWYLYKNNQAYFYYYDNTVYTSFSTWIGAVSSASLSELIYIKFSPQANVPPSTGWLDFGTEEPVPVKISTIACPNIPVTLYNAGNNSLGQLGFGNRYTNSLPTPLTGYWSKAVAGQDFSFVALSANPNKWFGTGNNNMGQLGMNNGAPNFNLFKTSYTALTGNWSQMACGAYHTMALSAGTSKVYATGYNIWGQLGLGNNTYVLNSDTYSFSAVPGNWSKVVCGYGHTMALSAGTNKFFASGLNNLGQTGLVTPYQQTNDFTALTGNWSNVVCGYYHTMALSAGTNRWFGTGQNIYGQLGLGNETTAMALTALTGNWSHMACGGQHSMALSAGTNKLFGAGYNDAGQLGLGDLAITSRNTFTAVPGNWSNVVCGYYHTMALSANTNKWFGAGANSYGQVGFASSTQKYPTFTELTGNWSQMACGYDFTMALSAMPPLV